MPMKKHKPKQIMTFLRKIEVEIANDKTAPQACKEAEITNLRRDSKVVGRNEETMNPRMIEELLKSAEELLRCLDRGAAADNERKRLRRALHTARDAHEALMPPNQRLAL